MTTLKPGDPLPLGINENIPDSVYHADHTSVSSSVLRELLQDGGQARYHANLTAPREPNPAFEFGHVAHALILPGNDEAREKIHVLDYADYRTKKARDERDALPEGHYPILRKDYEIIEAMRDRVYQHDAANWLLSQPGKAELTIVWEETVFDGEEEQVIRCKARPDFLHSETGENGETIFIDYKTTRDASPGGFEKAIGPTGYEYRQQIEWYMRGLKAVGYAQNPCGVFIAQEKTAPYLVGAYRVAGHDLLDAADLNTTGLAAYAKCVRTGEWAGYSPNIITLSTPSWTYRLTQEKLG